jgi:hypothetical protein
MDVHIWGNIAQAVIYLITALYSSIEKRRIRAQAKEDEDRRAKQLEESQKIAAEALAEVNRLTAEILSNKIDVVHDQLSKNTEMIGKAVEVGEQAKQEAVASISRWNIVDKAVAEKLLSGEKIGNIEVGTAKILTDIHKMEVDTNERVREVQQTVGQQSAEGD